MTGFSHCATGHGIRAAANDCFPEDAFSGESKHAILSRIDRSTTSRIPSTNSVKLPGPFRRLMGFELSLSLLFHVTKLKAYPEHYMTLYARTKGRLCRHSRIY